MKTKVGEAMMFGKKIYATKEALIGYELAPPNSYVECNSSKEFIVAINQLENSNLDKFQSASREAYLKLFSLDASKRRLKKAMDC